MAGLATYEEMAVAVGKSWSATKTRCTRLGVKPKRSPAGFALKPYIRKGAEHHNWNPDRDAVKRTLTVEWKERRREAIVRDGGKCVECGKRKPLHVHHIVHVGHGGSDDLENLVTLCVDHHRARHRKDAG